MPLPRGPSFLTRQHMHPAFSIVFFTTASGAGFALLFLLGLGVPLGLLPPTAVRLCRSRHRVRARGRRARLVGVSSRAAGAGLARLFAMALVLAVARGRAVGRDLLPAAVFGDRLGLLRRHRRALSGCAASSPRRSRRRTIYCTGMIYASLKPIHQWHNRWVVPNYFALGLMAGFLLLDFLVRFWVRLAGRRAAPDLDRRLPSRGGSRKPIGA